MMKSTSDGHLHVDLKSLEGLASPADRECMLLPQKVGGLSLLVCTCTCTWRLVDRRDDLTFPSINTYEAYLVYGVLFLVNTIFIVTQVCAAHVHIHDTPYTRPLTLDPS